MYYKDKEYDEYPDERAKVLAKKFEDGGPQGGPLLVVLGSTKAEPKKDTKRQLDKAGWQALYEEVFEEEPNSRMTIKQLQEAIEEREATDLEK